MRILSFFVLMLLAACGGTSSGQQPPSTVSATGEREAPDVSGRDDRLERVTGVLRSLSPAEQQTVATLALALAQIDSGDREPAPRLVLSLESAAQVEALTSLLVIFPGAASGIVDLFVKGPDSGTLGQIEAFRRACPNARTYWGYVGAAPADASAHLARWADATASDGGLSRQLLVGLDGEEHVALWSSDAGYMPPR